jgi:hypothetical protein
MHQVNDEVFSPLQRQQQVHLVITINKQAMEKLLEPLGRGF